MSLMSITNETIAQVAFGWPMATPPGGGAGRACWTG